MASCQEENKAIWICSWIPIPDLKCVGNQLECVPTLLTPGLSTKHMFYRRSGISMRRNWIKLVSFGLVVVDFVVTNLYSLVDQ